MPISNRSDEERIDAYFRWLEGDQDGQAQNEWAFDEIWELTERDPERAWPLTLSIIKRTPENFRAIATAARWLGNILQHYGPQFIERVEALSYSDPHFRKHLFMLSKSSLSPEIYARVRQTLAGESYTPPFG